MGTAGNFEVMLSEFFIHRVLKNGSCAQKFSTELHNCVRKRGYVKIKENNFAINSDLEIFHHTMLLG
jgi:hypothetical protein